MKIFSIIIIVVLFVSFFGFLGAISFDQYDHYKSTTPKTNKDKTEKKRIKNTMKIMDTIFVKIYNIKSSNLYEYNIEPPYTFDESVLDFNGVYRRYNHIYINKIFNILIDSAIKDNIEYEDLLLKIKEEFNKNNIFQIFINWYSGYVEDFCPTSYKKHATGNRDRCKLFLETNYVHWI